MLRWCYITYTLLCVRKRYIKYTVWRRISNNHENIANLMSTSCGVHGDGYKDLMEESGTYGASDVLWGLFVGRGL